MIKKIIAKILCFIAILSFFKINTFASTTTSLYIIFDKTNYLKNDIVKMKININNYERLSEVKLQIRINKNTLLPVKTNNKYFTIANDSFLNTDVVNDFIDEESLRLNLINLSTIKDGYTSNSSTNICSIEFIANKDIDNIYEIFEESKKYNCKISCYLFNVYDQIINYETKYIEKMKVKWDNEYYNLDLFYNIDNILKDIYIENRTNDDYECLLTNNVETTSIGEKTLNIAIYDKLTNDTINLSKKIIIKDNVAPTIQCLNSIKVKEKDIYKYDYRLSCKIMDNYDKKLNLEIIYYDKNKNQLQSRDIFDEYIKNERTGYISYVVNDLSGNKTNSEFVLVEVENKKIILNEQTEYDYKEIIIVVTMLLVFVLLLTITNFIIKKKEKYE